ncbi:MAG: hypothetical protein O7J95_04045 [Planctomycetota bacterium]|nr:hypothetical protein [Planctomycetota bacterium]
MRTRRNSGFLSADVQLALVVFVTWSASLSALFYSQAREYRGVVLSAEAVEVLHSVVELLKGERFEDVYDRYHGKWIEVPILCGSRGTASVRVRCYVDEADIPQRFGLLDLDGDPTTISRDVSLTYLYLPLRLTLNYDSDSGLISKNYFVVLKTPY